MLRQSIYFLASIIILLGIFVAVERTSSPFFQSCINDQQDAKTDTPPSKNEPSGYGTVFTSYIACSGRFIEGHGVGITALATIVIAAFTATLWIATRQQADLTRQEFIATHRPRVIVRYIQGPDFDADSNQFITVTFVNIGVNPATIEAFGGDLVRRNKQSGHFALGGLEASPVAITPISLVSGQRHFFTVKARHPYGDAEISEDAFDEIEVCAVGGIKYRDGIGILRETAFFRVHTGVRDSFVVSPNDAEMNYQD
jgi:hypothetical protein